MTNGTRWWVLGINVPSQSLYVALETDDYENALRYAQTYGGALLVVIEPEPTPRPAGGEDGMTNQPRGSCVEDGVPMEIGYPCPHCNPHPEPDGGTLVPTFAADDPRRGLTCPLCGWGCRFEVAP